MTVILEDHDRNRLTTLIEGWVASIDTPDDPLIGVAGSSKPLSPRELAQAVRDGTPVGNHYVQNLAVVVAQAALQSELERRFWVV